ncbi:retrovirus-related pol polyprotein from transposon TNT 1-94 [Tanacetum coccineum]
MTHSNPRRNMIPQAVLMTSGIKVVNTAKPKDVHNAVKRNIFNTIKASTYDLEDPSKQGRNNAQIDKDHFGSNGCTKSGEAGVQQRQKIMMKGRGFPEQKVNHKFRGGLLGIKLSALSTAKSKTVEGLKTAGYKVTTAGSRLLLLDWDQQLASKDLVRNLPQLKFDQHFCDACKIRKQAHASHKAKNIVSTTRCLELLHMDIFGPSAVQSYGGNRYTLVIVDDYSRKIEESLNVTFDETPPPSKTSPLVDDNLDEEEAIKVTEKKILENDIEDETLEIDFFVTALLESIRILLAYACALEFKLFQMDVKSASLNGFINEESEKFNLAFFIAKRMEFVTKQARLILPYGMLLTRLFKYVMSESPELFNESYVLYDRVMYPLTSQQERKTRKDYGMKRGRHSTSSSSAFDQPSSSHLNDDDDDGNDEGTSRAITPSNTRFFTH